MTASISEPAVGITARDRQIASLAALAVVVHLAEAVLPSPIPGIKPGLANAVVLYALLRHGWGVAAWVGLLRVLVGSLFLGSFLSPGFFLSLGGVLTSLAMLALVARLPGVTALGLGVAAALAHTAGQFAVAYLWFIPHPGLFALLPAFLTAALVFGAAGGLVVNRLCGRG